MNLDHSSEPNNLSIDQGVIRSRIDGRDLLQVDKTELLLEEFVDGQMPVGVGGALGPEDLVDDLKGARFPIDDSGHLKSFNLNKKINSFWKNPDELKSCQSSDSKTKQIKEGMCSIGGKRFSTCPTGGVTIERNIKTNHRYLIIKKTSSYVRYLWSPRRLDIYDQPTDVNDVNKPSPNVTLSSQNFSTSET